MKDSEVLATVSEHSGFVRFPLWLRHIRYNKQHFGFDYTMQNLGLEMFKKPAVVMAGGPAFEAFGFLPGLKAIFSAKKRLGLNVIAADVALPYLAQQGFQPDLVCSVDAHPVVANFYRRSHNILPGLKVALPANIHRDVVNECLSHEARVYWWQPMWHREMRDRFRVNDLPSFQTGGNVGTTAFVFSLYKQCDPIGLFALEFSWSDETPMVTTDFYKSIRRATGNALLGPERLRFQKVRNGRNGLTYLADPTYLYYRDLFRELWQNLKPEIREKVWLLNKQGILSAPGLRYKSVAEFLRG